MSEMPVPPPSNALRGRTSHRPAVSGRYHAVATGHPLASLAAMRILDAGGNAVDAGVAAGLALGVLQPDIVGFTGVAPIILYDAAQERVATISGLGRWPRAASLEQLQRDFDGRLPQGVLRTVVPAAIDAWVTALEQFGTMSFAAVAQDALSLAVDGFPAHALLCQTIAERPGDFRRWPSNEALFFPEGRVPRPGETFRQAELGGSIARLIEAERQQAGGRLAGLAAVRRCFYEGEIADAILAFYEREGGWLSAADLREFRVGVEPPQSTTFQGYEVFSCGAWCQGPMLLEFLNLLEGDPLLELGRNEPEYIHLVTEVMKLGFADREAYFGDPDFVDVALDVLLSKPYARTRRAQVSRDHACPEMPPPGEVGRVRPWRGTAAGSSPTEAARDTTYLCVVDRQGNGFSATPSDGYTGTPVIPGLGFAISDRGNQSRTQPGHPSAIAPWRRPRLTPNPALAMRDGRLALVFGTPGGDVQCQAMLQSFLNMAVFSLDPQEAIESPRFFTASFPNSFYPNAQEPGLLRLEASLAAASAELSAKGHHVAFWPDLHWRGGGVCAVAVAPTTGYRTAGADPRRECYGLAW